MNDGERTLRSVVSEILEASSALIRSELRLVRAEMTEKIVVVRTGLVLAAAGAILLLLALFGFAAAAVGGLMHLGLGVGLACLIVAVVVLVAGSATLSIGLRQLRASNLAPQRTVHQLKCDAAAARYQVQT